MNSYYIIIYLSRDGRDIAFSVNQGPVEKFYRDMFGAVNDMANPLKAIKLWSKWNSDIYKWAHDRMGHDSPR